MTFAQADGGDCPLPGAQRIFCHECGREVYHRPTPEIDSRRRGTRIMTARCACGDRFIYPAFPRGYRLNGPARGARKR